jgi:hypothetical protein
MAERDSETPPVLRVVPGGRYADWEAIYRDNATWVGHRKTPRVRLGDKWARLASDVFCGFRLAGFRPREAAASGDPLLDSADPAGAPPRALRR